MIVFEKIKSMNIDEFAEWYEANCLHDNDPCLRWWDKTYCQNCEGIIKDDIVPYPHEFAYCELNGNCRYFKDMDNIPDNIQTIKMWLENEYEEQRELE